MCLNNDLKIIKKSIYDKIISNHKGLFFKVTIFPVIIFDPFARNYCNPTPIKQSIPLSPLKQFASNPPCVVQNHHRHF